MRAWSALLLLAACGDEGVGGTVCTLIGCVDTMHVGLAPVADPTPYLGARVRVCVHAHCGEVALPDRLPPVGVGYTESSAGEPRVSATLGSHPDGRYGVSVDFSADESELEHGDEYTLEIRDRDGDLLVEHAWTAQYTESFPNGVECGPRCLTQSIVLAAP